MTTALETLVGLAGPALSTGPFSEAVNSFRPLSALLTLKNGFFAFDGALQVFPSGDSVSSYSFDFWNSALFWRHCYRGMTENMLFFAQDIIGTQFAIRGDGVYAFEPETAATSFIGRTLEDWARAVLDNPDEVVGWAIATEWNEKHGALKPLDRLMPKIPIICNGPATLDNLRAVEGGRAMRARGNLAVAASTAPAGTVLKPYDLLLFQE
jgi:hypothetical protein